MSDRIFIKGFDKDLKCRGYQFEIGKEYKIDLPDGYELTENDLCSDKVFHFCDGLSKVHEYYSCVLRCVMIRMGWSNQHLADLLGMNPGNLSKIINHTMSVKYETLCIVASKFGLKELPTV